MAVQGGAFVPQGLKPAIFLALNGTAKAVPYPNRFMKHVLVAIGIPRYARNDNSQGLRDHFRGNLLGDEAFDHVTDFDVAIISDSDAAFQAVAHFAGIFFEAA